MISVLIIALFVFQIAGMVALAMMVIQIKNGPVAAITGHIGPMTQHAKAIAERGKTEAGDKKDRVMRLVNTVKAIVASLKPNDATKQLPFHYGHLRTAFTTLGTARRVTKQARSMWAMRPGGAAKGTPPGPVSAKGKAGRRAISLAERLGLVPPIARHFGRVMVVAKIAMEARKQLARRKGA